MPEWLGEKIGPSSMRRGSLTVSLESSLIGFPLHTLAPLDDGSALVLPDSAAGETHRSEHGGGARGVSDLGPESRISFHTENHTFGCRKVSVLGMGVKCVSQVGFEQQGTPAPRRCDATDLGEEPLGGRNVGVARRLAGGQSVRPAGLGAQAGWARDPPASSRGW